jgi:hypothetical protein
MVSGSEALVNVGVPIANGTRVTLNGLDVTGSFHGSVGLVTGLKVGGNRLQVVHNGRPVAALDIMDYPITGPIFSGRQQQPFICQTANFVLPVTGVNLGPPLDANCSAATRVDYVYMSTAGTLKPLSNPFARPSDLAQTTTNKGQTVNYIVRVETGTINRAIYQIGILQDPVTDPSPDPWHKPAGWNGRLVYTFGGGCTPGYHQGTSILGGVLNEFLSNNAFLAQGYAIASSTLNAFGNDCNDLISAESLMMVKGRFINGYGVPVHTMGWGISGGSMQQHMIAQNYPGLLDGIMPQASFPDIFTIIMPATDCSLLNQAFNASTLSWSADQKTAVAGYPSFAVTCQAGWMGYGYSPGWLTAGASVCSPSIPVALLYNPTTNPKGARCDIYDNMINAFGFDPKTGFARRPLDNVGVQYGLAALNAGTITFDQFIDLNRLTGGYDIDGNIVSTRTVSTSHSLHIAYRSGRTDSGAGGLGLVPIIDLRPYLDNSSVGPSNLHSRYESFKTRARLVAANGDAGNQVMITANDFTPLVKQINSLDQWLDNIANDPAPLSHKKVVRHKPAELVDACYSPTEEYIPEPATYKGPGVCNQLYPSHADPRLVAGEPLVGDILKCQLKPVDPHDYTQRLSATQLAQIKAIFPQGVCDYSRPGIEQQLVEATWLSYPSPGKFELTNESSRTRGDDEFDRR